MSMKEKLSSIETRHQELTALMAAGVPAYYYWAGVAKSPAIKQS